MVMTQHGKLFNCPAGKDGKPLRRVLDVGTGTGIWSLDFGETGQATLSTMGYNVY